MQNVARVGALVRSDDRNDSHQWIVADVISLIEHVQASMRLIDSATAGRSPFGEPEIIANLVVLDDVTPHYVKVKAALETCNARLGAALQLLLHDDTRTKQTAVSRIVISPERHSRNAPELPQGIR